MEIIGYIILLVIGCVVLAILVDCFINSSSKIAKSLHISGYAISFLLIGAGTSMPELAVGIRAGMANLPDISYTNIIGSNIALMTFMISLPVLLGAHVSTRHINRSNDLHISILTFIFAIALALDGNVTRLDGAVLLLGYLIYGVHIYRKGSLIEHTIVKKNKINFGKQMLLFVTALIGIVICSEIILFCTNRISDISGIRLSFLGLSLLAIGTSLPEIVYSLKIMNDPFLKDGLLGNAMGSIVANSTLVLGLTALITPLHFGNNTLGAPSLLIVLFTFLIFMYFSWSKNSISFFEALSLIIIYFGFLMIEYNLV